MLLPILISDRWFSAVLLQSEPVKAIDSIYVAKSRVNNKYESKLTKKKIDSYINTSLKSDEYDITKAERLYISLDPLSSIIEASDSRTIVEKGIYTLFVSNYYTLQNIGKILDLDKSKYLNYLHYGVHPDLDLRVQVDKYNLTPPFYLHKGEDIVLSVNQVNDDEREEYISKILDTLLENLPPTGIFKVTLDDSFVYIPLLAGLSKLEQNIPEYFDKFPLNTDLKIIRAPGLKKIKISGEDIDDEERELENEKINHIDLKPDSKVHIELKTKKFKFKGNVYGSHTGILVDTRGE